ncbi:MAG TPA: hypothetical protein VM285_15615, partial [Polyangia bacterium]|nr:hypothetical protein [Polyangia bacterium]
LNEIVASRGRCGTCGLGRWTDGGGTDLGGPDGSPNHGDFDVPGGCDDIDLTPIEDGEFPLDELECDDESINSSFLFVDSFFGDDSSYYGSRRRPYASISAALDRADYLNGIDYDGHRVVAIVVTAGDYEETVTLRDGVSILGGFTVEASDGEPYWIRTDPPEADPLAGDHPGLTRIAAVDVQQSPKRLLGIEARDILEPTLLDRLFVDTASAETGVSLVGLLAGDSPGLHLRDCRVFTGPAPDGADGPQTPASPLNGLNGSPAGLAVVNNCPVNALYATGRRGGGAVTCSSPTPSEAANWSQCASLKGEPNPYGGTGGTNNCTSTCATCTASGTAPPGTGGADGSDATAVYSSVSSGGWWSGGAQVDGQRGGTGFGGGGGAGFWTNASCGKVNGGGGGAGGCGGSPGAGGEHGGSSLALVAVGSSEIIVESCSFLAGDAGSGGQGGPGGLGGSGGTGGTPAGQPNSKGGNGGAGGDGGDGAGGNGGISCALLRQATSTVDGTDSSWTGGSHAAAGDGAATNPGYSGDESLAAPLNSTLDCVQ